MSPVATTPDPRRWLPTAVDLWEALLQLAATALGLSVGIALVEDVSATNGWSVVGAALAVATLTWLVAAPLRAVANLLGGVVAFVLSLAAQITLMWAALYLLPGLVVESWWAAALVLLITGAVVAAVAWLVGASDAGYVVGDVLRRGRRRASQRRRAEARGLPLADPRPPGLLLVILDGVAEPVLRHALDAGHAPTMARWLDEGSHVLDGFWAQVPATTPASTAGLLHGTSDRIPAFRWWDAAQRRLVVTNHPRDAAAVETAMSDGEGLLAHGGAAVSTVFSGDAPHAQLVMSRVVGAVRSRSRGGIYVRFFLSPLVFMRTLVLTIGEMVKEVYQARLARLRDVSPRIGRGGWYVLLRGITNVTLRGLNTSLVAEHMEKGVPTIAVDFVDYDEIAHHAGPLRPEALRSLEGLDGVLRTLETVGEVAPRDYRIVVVSDHGQSLGDTFAQRAGMPLADLVTALMAGRVDDVLAPGGGEDWGPLNALLTEVVSPLRRRRTPIVSGPERPERAGRPTRPARPTRPGRAEPAADRPSPGGDDVVVIASGNLSLVWFTGDDDRLPLEALQPRWPSLVAGLAAHPLIAVVVVDSADGLLAVGPRGVRRLEDVGPDGEPLVEGVDPLTAFEDADVAARDLARAARLPHTGDLLLVSAVDDGRVLAFENQVGSHGGLGGDQNSAVLLHPTSLVRDDDSPLVGADAVFHQLVAWQRRLGLRP
ncbi:alkaline phosphatase family protein [Serinibacter arcticus]|uniref:alkaline phosphatase family protein n=1 Tax=Serinibacter arcticus TaxID=1655435 RepID=UPI000D655E27|nr:alkaline phosphatase family protein [Serinibacter arcticus]